MSVSPVPLNIQYVNNYVRVIATFTRKNLNANFLPGAQQSRVRSAGRTSSKSGFKNFRTGDPKQSSVSSTGSERVLSKRVSYAMLTSDATQSGACSDVVQSVA